MNEFGKNNFLIKIIVMAKTRYKMAHDNIIIPNQSQDLIIYASLHSPKTHNNERNCDGQVSNLYLSG